LRLRPACRRRQRAAFLRGVAVDRRRPAQRRRDDQREGEAATAPLGCDVAGKRDGEGDLGDLPVYGAEWKDEYSLPLPPDGEVPTPANPVFAPDSAPPKTDGPYK
jgi:hypothetical protein